MKLNVENLKDVIKRSTLNYLISSIQLKFNNDKIISNMISTSMDAVIMLELDNNVIDIKSKDDIMFNFTEPNINVKPFLDLIDDELIDIVIDDSKVKLGSSKQKMTFHFSSPDFVSSYKGDKPKIDNWFFNEKINDDIINKFNKIKKIAGKFGKIYFTIEDNKLYIETTDKTNTFANSMKFEIGDVDYKNLTLCFDFKNVNALLSLISKTYDNYIIKLHITEDEEGGMLKFEKTDGSENFYFVSYTE